MTEDKGPNTAASIRQRLLNIARDRGEDFSRTLNRYGLERFLYRLSISKYVDRFVLKGAMLYSIWVENPIRPTGDVDLLGYGDLVAENLRSVIREICTTEVEEDGLTFDINSIRIEEIREAQEYGGTRIKLMARLSNARIPIQIDVGLGDSVVPEAILRDYPGILDLPVPRLLIYPNESVISEKFHAIVSLGMGNSRMKDFFDIWYLINHFEFDGRTVCDAIKATFNARNTSIPSNTPLGLSAEFGSDEQKKKQWNAFLKRTGLGVGDLSFLKVIKHIRKFFTLPVNYIEKSKIADMKWKPGGPWQV